MRESDLLRHIARRSADLPAAFGHVIVGPGDDCAVVQTPRGDQFLLTVDHLVEHRHFHPGTPIELIARKAVARSISDIAAMGGTPSWGLATGCLPEGFAAADALFDAMARWARYWNAPLVGGDIASCPAGSPLVLTCTVAGTPHPHRGPILRSGAKPGDAVWVTGRFGASLSSGRHLSFDPRLDEARWLCDTLGQRLNAMIDVSDGLGIDAARIAAASGVRIELDQTSIPCSSGASPSQALADGEDYELCFVTAADAELPVSWAGSGSPPGPENPVRFTRIGRVLPGSGCVVLTPLGHTIDATTLGWDHGSPRGSHPTNPPRGE